MNGLISLCLLVVVGCVSAELSQFGPRRSSKESAEKPRLPNVSGGALAKPQNGAAQAAGQPARASSATSRPNRLPAKKRSSHSSAKLTASAQPELTQSSEEVDSLKEREHPHGKSQHGGQHHSKGNAGSLGKPARHARGSALPSAGPALPPSSSNSTNKTNGSSVASSAASGKHSSKESGDSHSSEESAKKHRPSKSDGGHSHKDSGSSDSDEHKSRPHRAGHCQEGADTKLTQAILKQILKGEPVKVKVEKKAKIFFEQEKDSDSSSGSSRRKEVPF
ncbi:hypothetical protein RvY_03267 [Ramazzottius varieornatus]|uniref:Uncharacterized protein n=1 Tax=Ramazzottius varieornatus TaxID=947166 RepID=A0A1D1UMG6_RAMVA|nr:hypothetical protein RvY_03267 [Ramazzottius varieornatus]